MIFIYYKIIFKDVSVLYISVNGFINLEKFRGKGVDFLLFF